MRMSFAVTGQDDQPGLFARLRRPATLHWPWYQEAVAAWPDAPLGQQFVAGDGDDVPAVPDVGVAGGRAPFYFHTPGPPAEMRGAQRGVRPLGREPHPGEDAALVM